jgi:chromosome segregation ATPase
MNEDLEGLPAPLRAELTRLRAERVVLVEEHVRANGRLREADLQLRELTEHRDQLVRQIEELADVAERAEQADALAEDVKLARAERDAVRAELTETRTERDRLRLRLLDAELQLSGDLELEVDAPVFTSSGAEQRAAELARELEATKQTVSWRVTAPLRAVRRRTKER